MRKDARGERVKQIDTGNELLTAYVIWDLNLKPPTVKKRLMNGGVQDAVTKATMDQYKTGEEEQRPRVDNTVIEASETSARQIRPIWKGIPWLLGRVTTHQDVATVLRKSLDATNQPPNGIESPKNSCEVQMETHIFFRQHRRQMEVHISVCMDVMGQQRNHQVTSYLSDDNISYVPEEVGDLRNSFY